MFFVGAPAGIRTPDTLLKRQVLCLLSYWGRQIYVKAESQVHLAGMAGLEPADEGVKVPCLTTWLHPYLKNIRDWDRSQSLICLGWVKGLEPSTPGTTIRCSAN